MTIVTCTSFRSSPAQVQHPFGHVEVHVENHLDQSPTVDKWLAAVDLEAIGKQFTDNGFETCWELVHTLKMDSSEDNVSEMIQEAETNGKPWSLGQQRHVRALIAALRSANLKTADPPRSAQEPAAQVCSALLLSTIQTCCVDAQVVKADSKADIKETQKSQLLESSQTSASTPTSAAPSAVVVSPSAAASSTESKREQTSRVTDTPAVSTTATAAPSPITIPVHIVPLERKTSTSIVIQGGAGPVNFHELDEKSGDKPTSSKERELKEERDREQMRQRVESFFSWKVFKRRSQDIKEAADTASVLAPQSTDPATFVELCTQYNQAVTMLEKGNEKERAKAQEYVVGAVYHLTEHLRHTYVSDCLAARVPIDVQCLPPADEKDKDSTELAKASRALVSKYNELVSAVPLSEPDRRTLDQTVLLLRHHLLFENLTPVRADEKQASDAKAAPQVVKPEPKHVLVRLYFGCPLAVERYSVKMSVRLSTDKHKRIPFAPSDTDRQAIR